MEKAAAFTPTPVAEIPLIVEAAHKTFTTGKTKPLAWRIAQIKAVRTLVEENLDAITQAIQSDLRRPEFDCVLAESMTVIGEANHTLSHIREWAAPESLRTPPAMLPGSSWIQREPLGTVCVIAPWNYPIALTLNPLIAALAAGNCVVLKPSEVSPASAALLQVLVSKYLDADAVRVVQGAVAETSKLLACKFDHILYTGNGTVAQIVMTAAAKHLTPVTLELGGKSPAIVAADADLDTAAKRIVWGKCLNAGQTCISPDYLLVEEGVADKLVSRIAATLTKFYGTDPRASPDLGRIINKRHWERVNAYLKAHGGEVVVGGGSDASNLWIEPTVIKNPKLDSALMEEEIFGPLLPLITVRSVAEAVEFVNARPKPLALYVFSSSSSTQELVLSSTSSGGVTLNDVVMHIANPELPFGGVGPSGQGAYHGRAGFETFSHRKSVFKPSSLVDVAALRLPPYSSSRLSTLTTLLKHLPWLPRVGTKDVLIVALAAAVIGLAVALKLEQR